MIAEMSRLEIVCLRSILPDVVAFLQEQGFVHVEEVPLYVEKVPGFLHRVHLDSEQKQEAEALEEIDRTLRELLPLLPKTPPHEKIGEARKEIEQIEANAWMSQVQGWSRELRSVIRQRTNVQDNLEVLRHYRNTLEEIHPLLRQRRGKVVLGNNARAIMLQGDVDKAVAQLTERLRHEIGDDVEVMHRHLNRNALAGLVVYPEEHNETVGHVLHELKIDPVGGPDKTLRGLTVDEVIPKLEASIQRQEARLRELEDQLRAFSEEKGAALLAMESLVGDRLAQLRIVHNFAQSEMTGVIHGWAPSDDLPEFERELARQFPGQIVVEAHPVESAEERKRVPTLLKNNEWVKPFEVLLSLLRPPSYGSLDPTLLVGLFFVVFYGFILGDAVYGLIIAGMAYGIRRMVAHIELAKHAMTVGIYMGISTFFWGVMFGEYLGGLIKVPHVWFYRGDEDNFMFLLALGIGFGLIHVPLSLCLGIYESLRFKDTHHAQEKLGFLIGLAAVGVAVLNYADIGVFGGLWALVLAGGMLVAALVLLILGFGALGLIQMLEIISLAGNVLSYARLMAVGVASVFLARAANDVAELVPNIFAAILVGFIMHTLAIAIGIISPAIHSLRLNYVEFLPKFFNPEGRSYQPFRKEAVYGD